jgi:tetratricopeptide (TPR) repeat protein
MSQVAQKSPPILRDAAIALKEGRFSVADAICYAILKEAPRTADAHYLLALSLLERGRLDEAEQSIVKAIKIDAKTPSYHVAHAQVFFGRGQYEKALKCFDAALGIRPGFLRALHGKGDVLMRLQRYKEAIATYGEALLQDTRNPDAFNNRGFAQQKIRRQQAAFANFTRAIALKPDFAEALNNRGNALQELGRPEDAIRDYDAAAAAQPRYALAFSNKANALVTLGRFEEGLASADQAIALAPSYSVAYNNKGYALQRMARHPEALESLDRAVELDPGYAEAHNNRGHSLHKLMRFDEAMASYQRAIDLRPGYAEAIWNRGLLRLLLGDLRPGWADIEYRWQCKDFHGDPRADGMPSWRGEDLNGRSLMVFAEQGFGDTFQFCRYLPLVAEIGAQVTFAAPKVIHRLLSTLPGDIKLQHMMPVEDRADFQSTLLSLPNGFGTSLETVPTRVPYLKAEPDLVEAWRRRIGSDGFKVGISWQGNPTGQADLGRSMPLAKLEPLSRIPGVRLICLQYKHGLEQLETAPAGMNIEVLGGFNEGPDGFVDSAAVMHCLDLVVTTDSAPAHLAGALGVPVWVMLMQVPDWRWLMDRTDSPWYPTMRLFRQKEADDWDGVARAVAEALEARLGGGGDGPGTGSAVAGG